MTSRQGLVFWIMISYVNVIGILLGFLFGNTSAGILNVIVFGFSFFNMYHCMFEMEDGK
jgi:hypothetical protein